MKEKNVILEIHDQAKDTNEKIALELVDGAYCAEIPSIQEAYKYMLPGDTITLRYAIFNEDKECVDTVEVDYTFPETRIHTPDAEKEKGTPFDRIITYTTQTEYDKQLQLIGLQQLYEDTKNKRIRTFPTTGGIYTILVAKIIFYSNYLSRLPNVAKHNYFVVNSENDGFQP